MNIVVQIAITLVSWLAIMFISTNLIGLFMRARETNQGLSEIASANGILAQEILKSQRMTKIIGAVLIVIFLGILCYFWNVVLAAAGLMLMLSRVPDLILEMKSGRALERGDMSKPQFPLLSTLLSWTSLLVVWYSIYQM